jgi:chromosome partitioning protein
MMVKLRAAKRQQIELVIDAPKTTVFCNEGFGGFMRTLAVLSQKGGTGKTTVAVHLAVAAFATGKRVVIADLDPQKSATEWRRARQSIGPGLIESKTSALFVAQQAAAKSGVDLMVLDTRPVADSDTAEAIRCADLCLIVLRPSFFDLKATARMADMTRAMKKPAFFVLNQAPAARGGREVPAVLETAEALRDLGMPLAPAGLRARTVYQSAVAKGLTAQEAEPGGPAAVELGHLWDYVEQILFAPRAAPVRRASIVRPRLEASYPMGATLPVKAHAAGLTAAE